MLKSRGDGPEDGRQPAEMNKDEQLRGLGLLGGPDENLSTSSGRPGVPVPPAAYIVSAILLGSAFVALLWVPSYAKLTPGLGGIPFFYWYSMLWLVLNALCQAAAYQLIVRRPRRRAQRRRAGWPAEFAANGLRGQR
jgi:hypothetical protein